MHVVGLPDSLRDALFTLMPPRKEGGYLNTKVLKDDLRCWLDRAVELNPVRPNVHTDSWLIALAPIDLAKLCLSLIHISTAIVMARPTIQQMSALRDSSRYDRA